MERDDLGGTSGSLVKEREGLDLNRKADEIYEATKRKYAEIFAVMERYRQSLKKIGAELDPAHVEAIETEVRERIRREGLKGKASGEAWLREIEESIERKGRPALREILQKGRSLTDQTQNEPNQVLRAYRKEARKQGIAVAKLFENIERTFWLSLSELSKKRLKAAGYDGPGTKQLTSTFKEPKKPRSKGRRGRPKKNRG